MRLWWGLEMMGFVPLSAEEEITLPNAAITSSYKILQIQCICLTTVF